MSFRLLYTWNVPDSHDLHVKQGVFSPTGNHLALLTSDRVLRVWEVKTGNLVYRFFDDTFINCLAWHKVLTNTVIIGTFGGKVFLLCDILSDTSSTTRDISHDSLAGIGALETGLCEGILAIAQGESVQIRRMIEQGSYGAPQWLPEPPSSSHAARSIRATSMHLSPDDLELIIAYSDHGVLCWDLRSYTCIWLVIPSRSVRELGPIAVSFRQRLFAVSNGTSSIDVYPFGHQMPTKSFPQVIPIAAVEVPTVKLLGKGTALAVGSCTENVSIWDIRTGEQSELLNPQGHAMSQALSTYETTGASLLAISSMINGQSCVSIWTMDIGWFQHFFGNGYDVVLEAIHLSKADIQMLLSAVVMFWVSHLIAKEDGFLPRLLQKWTQLESEAPRTLPDARDDSKG